MPNYKNYDKDDAKKSLKSADREKAAENGLPRSTFDSFGSKASEYEDDHRSRKNRARRRLPIAVDIIIAVLLLAITAAVIAGGYFALRYFTIDYDSVKIEYSVLVENQNVKQYADLAGKHLYMDSDSNMIYMGKVKSVDIYEADGAAVIKVEFEAKYKAEEGYFAENYKIAVSKKADIRTDSIKISGKIVELKRIGKIKKSFANIISVKNNVSVLFKEGIADGTK